MNTTNIYAVYDSKAEAYMQPFFNDTHGLAIRVFEKHVNDPATIFSQHPEDFTIFYIGTFDETNGKIQPNTTPFSLGVAIEFVKQTNQPPNLEAIK